ncbi:hypothetical protein GCM10009821_05030 [Aeromicrobium halocynthiae]|uniref:Peptidase MA-like domain-containing protein n=1 Tax=Aeromicrobium halocynthiae TaxID=560557 RepID=A0ABP5HBU5_9ACTN
MPRRPSANAVAALVLLALGAGLLLWQQPWSSEGQAPAAAIPADASDRLDLALRAMSSAEDERAFTGALDGDERSREILADAWQAREVLGVGSVELRLVDVSTAPDRPDGTAPARARVSWTTEEDSVLAGTTVREVEVELRFTGTPDGDVALRGVDALDDPLPLWLAGPLELRTADDARVVLVDGGDPTVDVARLAERAARTVRAQVPTGDDVLTVVSPATADGAAALLGRTLEQVERVAAVTTTVDGTADTPRVVVLNPDLFASMDERAAQVVVSHEAVHQLTGVVGTQIEPWVAEGFADWVALRDDEVPVRDSAAQALRRVRDEGPPPRLPTEEDFASAEHGIGAVYESAWLIFLTLEDLGVDEDRIIAFYEAVVGGDGTAAAAERHLGLGIAELTRSWQDYLTNNASTLS